ncbi:MULTISPECIES: hypothetical protein [Haloferax]|uniref:Uncharacterized protein n=2 Tax=Haloferax TaxID=2251 RepID=A0A6G1Z3V1_9EURY|nr:MULTISPECIES: hypothetical protein [Haloferax]KAB1188295.1 hypothetical protein Hfx1149_09765 [Haloferax sp. CBA1149]MRW80984.1 hypothetical protein [Haloferax marinisediminis]
MDFTRRQIVAGLGLGMGGVAGCSAITDHQADISIVNKTTAAVDATLEVTRLSDGKQLLRDAFTLPPGGPEEYTSKKAYKEVVGGETTRIHLAVENGPEGTYEFADEEKTDAKGVFIDVLPESIEFEEFVR